MSEQLEKVTATPAQIEAIYGIPKGTLANLRWQRKGPKFLKAGPRRVLYRVEDVEGWLFKNPVSTMDSIEAQR